MSLGYVAGEGPGTGVQCRSMTGLGTAGVYRFHGLRFTA